MLSVKWFVYFCTMELAGLFVAITIHNPLIALAGGVATGLCWIVIGVDLHLSDRQERKRQ